MWVNVVIFDTIGLIIFKVLPFHGRDRSHHQFIFLGYSGAAGVPEVDDPRFKQIRLRLREGLESRVAISARDLIEQYYEGVFASLNEG